MLMWCLRTLTSTVGEGRGGNGTAGLHSARAPGAVLRVTSTWEVLFLCGISLEHLQSDLRIAVQVPLEDLHAKITSAVLKGRRDLTQQFDSTYSQK